MRRSFISEAASEDEGAIDLTPMLDVVFIMLIFFIVTATFIKESGVEVNRPEASTANEKSDTTVLVAINSDNSVWIDKRRVDVRSVKANIQRLHAENPEGGVVIQSDKNATVKTFTEVLDAAREVVGNEKVSLAVDKK
ncbi:MAG TPA: biopolymer transporter ExbD [Gammaproteobacteria bacterium]|jgi:biopolymer transport protein ExbD|nr:biopolymer transporter ExbD [Xanthomonadales bacterium]HOP22762.1 biopolymer transporter ExbD [Gammaproteobacteria bacterium]MCB1593274.1 biopolymer transporter ExbD [Xanthomonadales bacterium]MCB1603056.1 biopolymer transporter ExbD [Xanthomonadales bacterium]HPI96623.1 biopolymer transporter ExbD [Gammaproteobacteria bacterium]